jgi:predicted naringenin-chalcone synthase
MYLHALATAVPPSSFTPRDCWEIASRSPLRQTLSRRSFFILRAILQGTKSGIAKRHFAAPDVEKIFSRTPDELNALFRREAPLLAGQALRQAVSEAGVQLEQVDALLISTCTGYLCPGVTSYVAEQLGLRPDVFLQDLVGLGCGAAIPTLRAAQAILHQDPAAVVACVSVEICSAAFYVDDDPGVLVSACLFADGAAASVWRGHPRDEHALACDSFTTHHEPALRDHLRFEQRDGRLRNLLHASVPQLAGQAVQRLYEAERARPGARAIERAIVHPGGRDVLDAIEPVLDGLDLTCSRRVLEQYGNMSSPSVLFALQEALRHGRPNGQGDWWLTSFGAGFSAHACRFGSRPPHRGAG